MTYIKVIVLIILFIPNLSAKEYYSKKADEETGLWLMYWGANRISQDFSIWTEAQYRFFELVSNPNQFILRTALMYHMKDGASLSAGYAYINTWAFEEGLEDSLTSSEHRLWEQFVLKNKLWLIEFEHRYRLEQRWVNSTVTEYSNRARYRLLMLLPLTDKKIIPSAIFVALYNEVFLNIGSGEIFDQNRLYFALGYQLSEIGQIQAGYLFQMLPEGTLESLQLAFVYNIDFR